MFLRSAPYSMLYYLYRVACGGWYKPTDWVSDQCNIYMLSTCSFSHSQVITLNAAVSLCSLFVFCMIPTGSPSTEIQ